MHMIILDPKVQLLPLKYRSMRVISESFRIFSLYCQALTNILKYEDYTNILTAGGNKLNATGLH